MVNTQIESPQISLVFQSANLKSSNFFTIGKRWRNCFENSVSGRRLLANQLKFGRRLVRKKIFLYKFKSEHFKSIFVRKKTTFLRFCGSFKSANKTWSANRKTTNCHIWGRSANLTKLVSPQVGRFAICRPPSAIAIVAPRSTSRQPLIFKNVLFSVRMAAVRLEHCTDLESSNFDAIVLVAPHHKVRCFKGITSRVYERIFCSMYRYLSWFLFNCFLCW